MFKKTILTLGILASQLSATEHRFIVDIMPGSFLVSNDINGLTNTSRGISETVEGSTSLNPNISLGYGLDLSAPLSIDLSVGTGVLINGAFDTTYTQAELTGYWTTKSKRFMIGPFFRVMNFDDSSWTTTNLSMEGTSGHAYGLAMMIGGEHFKFKMKLSQLTGTDIKLQGQNGYIPSSSSLLLDGTMLELGMGLRF